MTVLPAGWAVARLSDIAAKIVDGSHNPPEKSDRGLPMLSVRNVYDGRIVFDQYRLISEDDFANEDRRTRIKRGDVLLTIVGTIGRSAVVENDMPFTLQRSVAVIGDFGELEPRFLARAFENPAYQRWLLENAKGTAQKGVYLKSLASSELALPPLAEQRRIVAKIDRLTSQSRRARNHLDHIPRLVEKYKQAVLAAAFKGELTRKWRQTHTDRMKGPNGQSHFNLDNSERGAWPEDVLPEEWEWRRFQDVFVDLTDSARKLPQKEYRSHGPYPVVDQGATKVGGYTDRAELVHPADPPFIVFGDHTRCVKYIEHRFVQGADGVKVLRTVDDVMPSFGHLVLSAVDLPNKGYSRHMKFVRSTLFPVAPLPEQREIVRRAEAAFAWIDLLAANATSAQRLINRLDQAVLAKAFRGELVPQDPADEPASVLLEQIRAERGAAPKSKRERKAKADA